eukprot:8466924-Pyramimonas_sp.AAC.1
MLVQGGDRVPADRDVPVPALPAKHPAQHASFAAVDGGNHLDFRATLGAHPTASEGHACGPEGRA